MVWMALSPSDTNIHYEHWKDSDNNQDTQIDVPFPLHGNSFLSLQSQYEASSMINSFHMVPKHTRKTFRLKAHQIESTCTIMQVPEFFFFFLLLQPNGSCQNIWPQATESERISRSNGSGRLRSQAIPAEGHLAISIVSTGTKALVFDAGTRAAEQQRVLLQATFCMFCWEGGKEMIHLWLQPRTLEVQPWRQRWRTQCTW